MTAIDTSKYYNNLADLTTTSDEKKVRTVTSSADGDKVTNEGDTSAFSNAASSSLGKDDFLTLLVTQMQYQDPLEPADNTEYVAQLAQFSQLENTTNMATSMDELSENMYNFMSLQTLNSQSVVNSSATPLIGKEVRVMQSSLSHTKGDTKTFDLHMNKGYSKGTLQIMDSKDNVVAEIAVSRDGTADGDLTVKWDGNGTDGKALATGEYTMKLATTDGETAIGYAWDEGVVSSVGFSSSGADISVNGTKYAMAYLVNVTNAKSGS